MEVEKDFTNDEEILNIIEDYIERVIPEENKN